MNFGSIIMAAGKGSRLGLPDKPKTMVQVGGKMVIDCLLDILDEVKVDDKVVVTGHLGDVLVNHLEPRSHKIKFAKQLVLDGTAGAVSVGLNRLDQDTTDILIFPGDNCRFLTDKTLKKLISHHRENNSIVTTILTPYQKNDLHKTYFQTNNNGKILKRILIDEDSDMNQALFPTGILCLNRSFAEKYISKLPFRPNGERIITGLIDIALDENLNVRFVTCKKNEIFSINTEDDRLYAETIILPDLIKN